MDDPYLVIRSTDNHRILMHITNAGFLQDSSLSFKESERQNGQDRHQGISFRGLSEEFGTIKVNNSVSYTLTSCLFYVPGHYRMRYRDPRTSEWYNYDDLNPKIEKVGVNQVILNAVS